MGFGFDLGSKAMEKKAMGLDYALDDGIMSPLRDVKNRSHSSPDFYLPAMLFKGKPAAFFHTEPQKDGDGSTERYGDPKSSSRFWRA